MKSRVELTLLVSSHTDSKGTEEHNMRLSSQRSASVKKYLVSKGIDSNRIVTKNYGESQLLNECSDDVDCPDEKHEVNRRVELKYIK